MPLNSCDSPVNISIMFQSQTRSRPSCHVSPLILKGIKYGVSISNEKPPQLPLLGGWGIIQGIVYVSISNEKPPQLPLSRDNRNMDAVRLFQSQTRSRPSCHLIFHIFIYIDFSVSISNEKPPQLPHYAARHYSTFALKFQSQTRSRPSCHRVAGSCLIVR